jgi:hypothetical protein
MATYLLYHQTGRPAANSTRRNAVLASGASESAARDAANAARPDGETKVPATWAAQLISATDDVAAPIWFQGRVAEPIQRSAGR